MQATTVSVVDDGGMTSASKTERMTARSTVTLLRTHGEHTQAENGHSDGSPGRRQQHGVLEGEDEQDQQAESLVARLW